MSALDRVKNYGNFLVPHAASFVTSATIFPWIVNKVKDYVVPMMNEIDNLSFGWKSAAYIGSAIVLGGGYWLYSKLTPKPIRESIDPILKYTASKVAIVIAGAKIYGAEGAVIALAGSLVYDIAHYTGSISQKPLDETEAQKQIRELKRDIKTLQRENDELTRDLAALDQNDYQPLGEKYRDLSSRHKILIEKYVETQAQLKLVNQMKEGLRNQVAQYDIQLFEASREQRMIQMSQAEQRALEEAADQPRTVTVRPPSRRRALV